MDGYSSEEGLDVGLSDRSEIRRHFSKGYGDFEKFFNEPCAKVTARFLTAGSTKPSQQDFREASLKVQFIIGDFPLAIADVGPGWRKFSTGIIKLFLVHFCDNLK